MYYIFDYLCYVFFYIYLRKAEADTNTDKKTYDMHTLTKEI